MYKFRTKKALAALCTDRAIEVKGDKRKLATYIAALEQADKATIKPIPQATKKSKLIDNNCDFGDRICNGTAYEKRWLVKKDGHGAGASLVFQKQGDFYITYAGDARRAIASMQLPTTSERGVLTTGFPAHAIDRYVAIARQCNISIVTI